MPRCPGGITVLLVRRRKLRLAGSLRGRRPRHRGSTPGRGCEPLAVSVASHCQGGDGLLPTQNPLVPLSGFLHGSRGWRMWTGAWRPGALGFPRASDPKCAASRPALVWELVMRCVFCELLSPPYSSSADEPAESPPCTGHGVNCSREHDEEDSDLVPQEPTD